MNLEFEDLCIDCLPVYAWISCGRRVQSLEFYDCRWSDQTIKNVVLNCVELVTFRIVTVSFIAESNLSSIFCSLKLLNDMIGKKVKRTQLRVFALCFADCYHRVSQHAIDTLLNKIFLIYPGMEYLTLKTCFQEHLVGYDLKHSKKDGGFSGFTLNGFTRYNRNALDMFEAHVSSIERNQFVQCFYLILAYSLG